MVSRIRAVISSRSFLHDAMSPAPTKTTGASGGGGAVTVMAAVPPWPSLVAVTVAEPAVTPVTTPFPSTAATVVALLAHVTVRPLSGVPLESLGVAVSGTVAPTRTAPEAGDTLTDATGARGSAMVAVAVGPALAVAFESVPAPA